ncbi:hypothetical protein GGR52DRAFT_565542 [Hypoxylon sp. FL1284]|nr:hypothetical protein GGR52DRAFT_565542 [Hypoxylon sp. FL1284]
MLLMMELSLSATLQAMMGEIRCFKAELGCKVDTLSGTMEECKDKIAELGQRIDGVRAGLNELVSDLVFSSVEASDEHQPEVT